MWFWLVIAFIWFGLGHVVGAIAFIIAIPLTLCFIIFSSVPPFSYAMDWQRRFHQMTLCRVFVGNMNDMQEPLRTRAAFYSEERTIAALRKYMRCRYYIGTTSSNADDIIFRDFAWAANKLSKMSGEKITPPTTWDELP